MGLRNIIIRRRTEKYGKRAKQNVRVKQAVVTAVEKQDLIESSSPPPPPLPVSRPPPSVIILTTRTSHDEKNDDIVSQQQLCKEPTKPVPILLLKKMTPSPTMAALTGIAPSSQNKQKKKVRFFLKTCMKEKTRETCDTVSTTSTQEILEELDEMLELQKLYPNGKTNEPITVVVMADQETANDGDIEVKVPSMPKSSDSVLSEDSSADLTDDSNSTKNSNCIHIILKTALGGTLGCIHLSADAIRESGNQIDQLLDSTVQRSQEAWKTTRLKQSKPPPPETLHKRTYSTTDVMYHLINFVDKKSYLLEGAACTVDDTVGWFQCDGLNGYD